MKTRRVTICIKYDIAICIKKYIIHICNSHVIGPDSKLCVIKSYHVRPQNTIVIKSSTWRSIHQDEQVLYRNINEPLTKTLNTPRYLDYNSES